MDVKATISALIVFTIGYLVPLVWSPSWQHTLLCLGLAAIALLIPTISVYRGGHRGVRRPSLSALKLVGLTSGVEMLAVVVALFLGFVFDAWWWLAPLIVTTVLLHFLALTNAFRRRVDFLVFPIMVVAAVVVWTADHNDPLPAWGVAGGLAAGVCLGYALALWRSAAEANLHSENMKAG